MKPHLWRAGAVFLATWIPATLWLGIRWGRTLRLGADRANDLSPLIEGIIQFAFVTLVPAALVALLALALLAGADERRAARERAANTAD